MGQYTQIIVISVLIIGAIVMFIAIARNMRKQEKEYEKKQREALGNAQRKTISTPQPVATTEPVKKIVLDKEVIVKRPGKKVHLYGSDQNIIAWCMKKAGKQYSHAKLTNCQYVAYRDQPGRKKAKGYWEFTIKYAVGRHY